MSYKWMKLTLCSILVVAGCDSSGEFSSYENAPLSKNAHTGHHHEGVHGGLLIEFDEAHAHHAELVFDEETRDITLYFYGATIGEAHPASGLVFELDKDDDEFHLDHTASPLEGETAETASCFVIAGSTLPAEFSAGDTLHGHFHVTLDGQDFTGSFTLNGDDHGEHDDHGDEDHGEDGDEEDGHHDQ